MNYYNFKTKHILPNSTCIKTPIICSHNNTCLSVTNFITKDLCNKIIDFSEQHNFESLEKEYVKSYRNSERILIKSSVLADNIWKSLLQILDIDDFKNVAPRGFGTEGNWVIHSVNPMFRISKYHKGGHFSKHSDAGYVINDNYRSSFSLLIYLNQNYEGGHTSVYQNDIKYDILPQSGKMVMFNHNLEHQGNRVNTGYKYILRADIMCLRINVNRGLHSGLYLQNKDYIRAEKLYAASIHHKKCGNSVLATKTFLEAMEIHYALNNTSIHKLGSSNNTQFPHLTKNITNNIFSYILNEGYPLFYSLLAVSNSWNEMIKKNFIWYNLYRATWGRDIKSISNLMSDNRWYDFTQSRNHANNHFKIFGIDLGYNKVSFNLIDTKIIHKPAESRDQILRKYAFIKKPDNLNTFKYYGQIPSICANTKGHFWGAGSGVNQYAVGYQLDVAHNIYNIKNLWYHLHLNFNTLKIIIQWIYRNGLKNEYKSQEHPMLLAVPFFIDDSAKKIISTIIFKSDSLNLNNTNQFNAFKYVTELNAPYLKFICREKLPLLTLGIDNAIVILLDSECSTIVTINNFNVIKDYSYHLLDIGKDLVIEIIKLLTKILKNVDLAHNIYFISHSDTNIFNIDWGITTPDTSLLDSIQILPYNSIIKGLELYTKLPNIRGGFTRNNNLY